MAITIRKVILNHSMSYLIRNKKDIKLNLGDEELNHFAIKLMVQFCKKYNLIHRLYLSSTRIVYNLNNFTDFAYNLTYFNGTRTSLKDLQLFQLWRFFVLEALENNHKYNAKRLIDRFKYVIEANGFRESEEIEKLFMKHNLRNHHLI